ncbi:class E sortase [Rugosimonospora africana]|uniref:Class E sortase n=1 Tax=Rugosimonospora africana TaxID=556532 RepID=A0A8J3VPH0_9ACTN|nr:class E sortase [Rugosimonospora africana]GIH13273.1 class E sortase [Rugosimonospora africana]
MDVTMEMSAVEDASPGTLPRPAVPVQPEGPDRISPVPGRFARTVRTVARTGGELMITFGVIVLLFVAYQLYGRVGMIKDHQRDLDRRLAQNWVAPPTVPSTAPAAPSAAAPQPPPPDGSAIGRLYIPKLDLDWVVVEGVSLDDLRGAPGHYPSTAMPGQIGNFATAGHRERGMFWDLDEIQSGDYLVMETETNWYVYKVYQNEIVSPHAMEVIAPTPDKPGVTPTQAEITLTTCNPKWDNYQRMIVHGTLVQTTPHDVRPAELGS